MKRFFVLTVAVAALMSACASTADPAKYHRVPVQSTPFTSQKVAVDEVICAERGKALACKQDGVTTDCWCEPRDAADQVIDR